MAVSISSIIRRHSRSLERLILASVENPEVSISSAMERGWNYVQVLDEAARLQKLGFLVRQGGDFSLTALGGKRLVELRAHHLPESRPSERVEQINPLEIYVPAKAVLGEIRKSLSSADESRKVGESPS